MLFIVNATLDSLQRKKERIGKKTDSTAKKEMTILGKELKRIAWGKQPTSKQSSNSSN
jgi:hypothetical protein